jgi:hypothetical protein
MVADRVSSSIFAAESGISSFISLYLLNMRNLKLLFNLPQSYELYSNIKHLKDENNLKFV